MKTLGKNISAGNPNTIEKRGSQHGDGLSGALLPRIENTVNKTQLVEMDHVVILPMTR